MKLDEIKSLIKNGTKKNDTIPLVDIFELNQITKVNLDIDRDSNEYFYKVKIKDLIDSEIRKEVLSDNGWVLSSDEEFILLFL